MVACDDEVEGNHLGMDGELEKPLRVVLFLSRPIPEPKRGYQLCSRLEANSLYPSARLKHARNLNPTPIAELE